MNKLTKVLSVFVIAGAIGTGVAGVAGCTPKKPNDEGGHTHNYTLVNDNNGKHHEHCDVDGCDAPDKAAVDHVWGTNDKCECGATKPAQETPGEEGFKIPADIDGLIIDGVQTETITLSETNKSHTINKAGIKVYLAKGTTKGTEVPAANYTLTLTKNGAAVESWENITVSGAYAVRVKLKDATLENANMTLDDLTTTITVTVSNPVKANSLVVKEGTFEQASDVDKISSTWKYEVTRANGDKEEVAAANVTVSGLDTMAAGENKTATISCTIDGVAVTGSVKYTITADTTKVTQSFALNFSALTKEQEDAIKEQADKTHNPLSLQNGRFEVCSTKSGSIDSHNKDFDGKHFAKRLKMNGTSDSKGAPRYIKVHADGPATLTIYAYCNGDTEGQESTRKVGVYGAMTVSEGATPTAAFTNPVSDSQATTGKRDTKHVFTITEAGDYYITCEGNGICFTYVQLDQQVAATGNQEITLGGNVVASSISAKHSSGKSAHVALGTTFESIKSAYTVTILGVNDVTCDSGETDVTGDAKVTFVVPEDFETAIGEKVITVKYDGTVTTTIKVYVESEVSGIYGMNSSLNSDVSTQVAAGAKLTLKKSDIVNTLLGAEDNENAQITAYTVTYNETEITEDGTEFEISATAYTVTITATVSDGTNTATLTATVEFTVSQRSTASKQVFTTPETVPTNATVAKDGVIVENNLFKAVADGEMTYFDGDATKSSIAKGDVSITLKDGTKQTVKTGLRTAATSTAGDKTTSITITASEKITLTIYVVFSNSSYNSNKTGKLNYKVGEGETTTVDTGSNRLTPNVIEVTLEAGQSITIDSDKGSDKGHLYLFGIEAEQVAAE